MQVLLRPAAAGRKGTSAMGLDPLPPPEGVPGPDRVARPALAVVEVPNDFGRTGAPPTVPDARATIRAPAPRCPWPAVAGAAAIRISVILAAPVAALPLPVFRPPQTSETCRDSRRCWGRSRPVSASSSPPG